MQGFKAGRLRPALRVRYVRMWLGSLALVLLIATFTKRVIDLDRESERDRLIVNVIEQQEAAQSQAQDHTFLIDPELADNSPELESWLIARSNRSGNASALLSDLRHVLNDRKVSPNLRTSIQRWQDALVRWSAHPMLASDGVSARDLLREGRLHYFEAKGYEKIGRGYDGAVLSLWASALLRRFLIAAPGSPSAPEALYLLGDLAVSLRHADVAPRGNRYLNLCSDLYPSSIWASRANAAWRVEIGNGTG